MQHQMCSIIHLFDKNIRRSFGSLTKGTCNCCGFTRYQDCSHWCTHLGMKKPNWQSSSTQSGLTTQIRTHPRATQQGRVKCRRHLTVPAVPTQEAIPEEGGYLKKHNDVNYWNFFSPWDVCDRSRSVKFAADNVVHGSAGVADSEAAGLDAANSGRTWNKMTKSRL